ncbi:MAG: DUF3072 domain-containing protein [Burkholderiaceae bacterium]
MTDDRTQSQANRSNMEKRAEDWATGDESMTGAQRSSLTTLSQDAEVPFEEHLTQAEAARRIDELQRRTGCGLEGSEAPQKGPEEQTRESGEVEADAQGGDLRGVKDR